MERKKDPRDGFVLLLLLWTMVAALCAEPMWRAIKFGGRYFSTARLEVVPLPMGSLCPPMNESPRLSASDSPDTATGAAALEFDAAGELMGRENGMPTLHPRVAIAKLHTGKDIEEVNRAICSVVAWKGSGSTWILHPIGNYDFVEVDLVSLLYLFRDRPDRLYPETARHIVDALLIENGAVPRPSPPRTRGLVTETENHILMTEGTRYLKNQWYFERGTDEQRGRPEYDNDRNGLGEWLLEYLRDIQKAGFYEFNSIPYMSFTLRALLNLEAFPRNAELAATARHIIDIANWQYALGSLDLRRCAPFRRQPRRAGLTDLQADEHTSFMRVWTGYDTDSAQLQASVREATMAAVMPYRLPKAVREWTLAKSSPYFVRFGHGPQASPEIYSGGPDYLISAGGVARGWRSQIVARPTSLMLRDGALDLRGCFHLVGRGPYTEWNNTGVCDRFACTNGKAIAPEGREAIYASGIWSIYTVPGSQQFMIAAANGPSFALLALFPEWKASPGELAGALAAANPNEADLAHAFRWPEGNTVEFDVNAPKGTWVISAIAGKPVDRDYDQWPQIDGEGPMIRFDG